MQEDLRKKLQEAQSFGEVFQVVKKAVQSVLGIRRAGLELILMDLPREVKALHRIGSNVILLNRKTLEAILKTSKTKLEVNSYLFSILLHEYLHSLGIVDEDEVKMLSIKVIRDSLGEDHIAYKITSRDLADIHPETEEEFEYEVDGDVEIIQDFDVDNADYIT